MYNVRNSEVMCDDSFVSLFSPVKCIQLRPLSLSLPFLHLSSVRFYQRAYRWLQTMIFAVEEINRDPVLLPNLTLGFLAADTCLAEGTTLGAALAMVTGQEASVVGTECGANPEVPVIIGDARSSASIVVAQTLGPFELPMVRHAVGLHNEMERDDDVLTDCIQISM